MKRCSLLKLSLLLLSFLGTHYSGIAQETASGPEATHGQSGIGTVILIVVIVLGLIFLIVRNFKKQSAMEPATPGQSSSQGAATEVAKAGAEGEIHAAIAMALYLYSNELHDQENPVITMIKVSKTYSPWSSKIYGLRKLPR